MQLKSFNLHQPGKADLCLYQNGWDEDYSGLLWLFPPHPALWLCSTLVGTWSYKVVDKFHGITICGNTCCVSSIRPISVTPVLWQPLGQLVCATGAVSLSFLPVCPSILFMGLGGSVDWEAADLPYPSLCFQKPGPQTPSLHAFPKPQWGRHNQALCCFNSFLLIMQMFPGKSRGCITTDFYMLSVPLGSVHSSSGWEMSIYILLDQCAPKSWHALIIVICHPHYLQRLSHL